MEISNLRKINKGSLIASFDVVFPKWAQFTIHDCKLFEKEGKRWISFPSIPFEKDGKTMYKKTISFEEEAYKKIQFTLKNLVEDEMHKQKEQGKATVSPDPWNPSKFQNEEEEELPF